MKRFSVEGADWKGVAGASDPPPHEGEPLKERTATGTEVVYEAIRTPMDLSHVAVEEALRHLGYEAVEGPVLVVSARRFQPDWMNRIGASSVAVAVMTALTYGLRVRIDEAMTDSDEWYIEWEGRRVGSEGP